MITIDDWQDIDTVLLDMDGTLLDLHFDNYFWQQHLPKRYAHANGISEQQALDYLTPIFRDEYSNLQWYCIEFWERKTGLDVAALKREVQHLIRPRPYSVDFLKTLRRHRKHVLLVTNAHHKSVRVKMENTQLDVHLDAIHSSHDFGAAKEDPAFWPRLQRATGFEPERALFIDDNLAVLDAAHNYGIRYVLAIEQPDSQRERTLDTHHRSIRHFDEIMPA